MTRRLRFFVLITGYYSALLLLLVIISNFMPHLLEYLPFGGLSMLERSAQSNISDFIGEVVRTVRSPADVFDTSIRLAMAMTGAILLMLPVRWVYISVGLHYSYNHAVAASLIILPVVVTGIVVIVQYSLALAFSLAGIVAGVRYRTTLKNTSDALFIFGAIGVGLAAGTNSLGIAMVISIFFSYTVLALPPIQPHATDSPKSPWKVNKSSPAAANPQPSD